MIGLQDERRCDADSGELVEFDSCDKTPVYAKVKRARGGIAEIASKVLLLLSAAEAADSKNRPAVDCRCSCRSVRS